MNGSNYFAYIIGIRSDEYFIVILIKFHQCEHVNLTNVIVIIEIEYMENHKLKHLLFVIKQSL
jgi:hypothetical protein